VIHSNERNEKRKVKRKSTDSDSRSQKRVKKSHASADKKERKKIQNKSAANRYRMKKRVEQESVEHDMEIQLNANEQLKQALDKLQMEYRVVQPLAEAAFAGDPKRKLALQMLHIRVLRDNLLDWVQHECIRRAIVAYLYFSYYYIITWFLYMYNQFYDSLYFYFIFIVFKKLSK